jgi:hypothetical protein
MKYNTILDAAYHNDYDAIVDLLNSPDPLKRLVHYRERQTDFNALMHAINHQNVPMVKLLLKHCDDDDVNDVNVDDDDALAIAKSTKNEEIILLILSFQKKLHSRL